MSDPMTGAKPDILAIFTAAAACPTAEERAQYLDAACGDDPTARARVETLLRAHFDAGNFLGGNAAEPAPTIHQPPDDAAGTVVGPYKLLQKIGEGGMGVVYMAEQTEPVERRVALKIIKPGLDTRQVIARFEAERQALAMMDHPNIARVLDAGATNVARSLREPDRTRPFFVMELVKGLPITQYCDEQHLTPRERLELFLPVCRAVQHAHQKGVIHRDLKPSNILVARYDDKAVPKIIDFGVAKAVSHRLTEKTMFTQYGQIVGTIEYMSPEQAQFNQLDVDTRSDIYSLGVLLYELLTGETPFDKKRLRTAAFDELLRIIREEEPPRPSARVSTLAAAQQSTVATARRTAPRDLSLSLCHELDWIVMKALEKDRGRRYETANGLAADVQRYLADEAVQACPPSVGYRFRKFARRNKRAMVTATLLGAMLLVLAGSFGWMARDRAAQRGRNAEAVEALLDRCEEALRADRADRAAVALEAAKRRAADGGAEELAGRLASCRAELRLLRALDAIDTFRWTWAGNSFPDPKAIVARWSAALVEYGAVPGEMPAVDMAERVKGSLIQNRLLTTLDAWLALSRSAWVRAVLRSADPDPYRDAVRDAVGSGDTDAVAALVGRPEALDQPARFAAVLGFLGDCPIERAREMLESAVWARPGDFTLLMTLSHKYPFSQPDGAGERVRWLQAALAVHPGNSAVRNDLAITLLDQGNLDAAIAQFREAARLSPADALFHDNLGNALLTKGSLDDAIVAYREAIRLDPKHASAWYDLGVALFEKGDVDDAIVASREAIRLDPKHAPAWHNLGIALLKRGNLDDAIAAFKEAARLEPANPARRHNLGRALRDQGDVDGAITELREAIRLDPTCAAAHGELGHILYDGKGDYDGAIVALKEAIRLDPTDTTFRDNLGAALFKNGDVDGAITELRELIRLDPTEAYAHYNLGNALQKKGKVGDAIAAYREAVRLDPKDADFHNKLGWLLATGPDALRHGKQAVEHATTACKLTAWNDPNPIDTLAAAHAEAGDFDRAVEFQKMALSFPDFQQEDGTGGRERLDLYERKMPYRDPGLTPMED